MTLVKGEIESYKKVKALLKDQGITRFQSLVEIISFMDNFAVFQSEVRPRIVKELAEEGQEIQRSFDEAQKRYEEQKMSFSQKLSTVIEWLKNLVTVNPNNPEWKLVLQKVFSTLTQGLARLLESQFDRMVRLLTQKTFSQVRKTREALESFQEKQEQSIEKKVAKESAELKRTKHYLDHIYNYIAGAVGEDKVVKELEKRPGNQVLFNDFSLNFNKPIYHRAQNDRIFSIQIDHLLVTRAGLFVIETKNWSKKSVNALDMRSPIDQIRRTHHALFVLLNGQDSTFHFGSHHWGEQKLPIRNLLVMINHKPREKFKFVEVKTLPELNPYLNYFDPILSETQVQKLAHHLESMHR